LTPAILGAIDAALAFANSVSGVRRLLYARGAVAQLALVGIGWTGERSRSQ
jgi:hypothetical protein